MQSLENMKLSTRVRPLNPSEVFDAYWVGALNPIGASEPEPRTTGGKWMEFVYTKNIDLVWEKVRRALVTGQLGPRAKASTMLPNPNSPRPDLHVICVYTYDYRDKADVLRVRKALRKLGIVRKISYKADEDTRAGKYRATGHTGIAKYHSDGTEDELVDRHAESK